MSEPIRYHLIKNTSAFYRMTQSYMTEHLQAYDLRSGQQFFLEQIARNPGISLQELANLGYFDAGTATRAVQKLVDKGFVTALPDEKDRRIRRLNITEEARPIVAYMKELKAKWRAVVMEGYTEDEKLVFSQMLERLVDNAHRYLEASRDKEEES